MNDRYRRGQTIKQWIKGENKPLVAKDINEPSLQFKNYIASVEVKKLLKDEGLLLRAHLVVVVGSRHILVWDMNNDGELADMPYLARPLSNKQPYQQIQPQIRQIRQPKIRHCSLCGSSEHNKRTCPQRNAMV
jgi:hypothetical protein